MPTGGNGLHLFVICTDMCANNKFVLANITTWTGERCDPTVQLNFGDHPFIDRHSYVLYQMALVERRITIEAGVSQGRFAQREDMPAAKVQEIQDGLMASRFTPRKVKNYLVG